MLAKYFNQNRLVVWFLALFGNISLTIEGFFRILLFDGGGVPRLFPPPLILPWIFWPLVILSIVSVRWSLYEVIHLYNTSNKNGTCITKIYITILFQQINFLGLQSLQSSAPLKDSLSLLSLSLPLSHSLSLSLFSLTLSLSILNDIYL